MKQLFLLFAGLLVTVASYAQSGKDGNLTWELKDGTLTISGSGAMPDYGSGSQPWSSYRNTIKSVVVADG